MRPVPGFALVRQPRPVAPRDRRGQPGRVPARRRGQAHRPQGDPGLRRPRRRAGPRRSHPVRAATCRSSSSVARSCASPACWSSTSRPGASTRWRGPPSIRRSLDLAARGSAVVVISQDPRRAVPPLRPPLRHPRRHAVAGDADLPRRTATTSGCGWRARLLRARRIMHIEPAAPPRPAPLDRPCRPRRRIRGGAAHRRGDRPAALGKSPIRRLPGLFRRSADAGLVAGGAGREGVPPSC